MLTRKSGLKNFTEKLAALVPNNASHYRKIRIMAEDEARCGLISWHKRRYHPQGQRPVAEQQRKYQWTWLYSALQPSTGELFSLYLPRLDAACYEVFLAELAKAYPDDFIILIRDNAPAHRKTHLAVPDNIVHLPLPPYSPELNPVERLFRELRRRLANRLFASVDELHKAISEFLQGYLDDPEALQLLTDFPWWWFACAELRILLGNSDIVASC